MMNVRRAVRVWRERFPGGQQAWMVGNMVTQ